MRHEGKNWFFHYQVFQHKVKYYQGTIRLNWKTKFLLEISLALNLKFTLVRDKNSEEQLFFTMNGKPEINQPFQREKQQNNGKQYAHLKMDPIQQHKCHL